MTLELVDIILGLFSAGFVVITFIVGGEIISRYFKYRARNILLVGLAWIGLATPWIPDALKPLYILIDPNQSQLWIVTLNLIINNIILPIPVLFWLIAFTKMLRLNQMFRKATITVVFILSVIYEIFLIYFYINDLQMGLQVTGYLYSSDYIDNTLIVYILVALITGLAFAFESLRSQDKEVKVKGLLLIVAFILFAIGATIDALYITYITNIYSRLILVVSSIMFYMGFILPEWAKKIFLN
ncbi:MAG: hypothetical protein ACOC4M_07285 [Promethearchaeia archaeon]